MANNSRLAAHTTASQKKMRKKLRNLARAGPASQESVGMGRLSMLKKRKLERTLDDEEIDPLIKAEDMEIKRLEKLLGINKKSNRKGSAEKLNKEYSEFEGIEGDFGDFLMELDDLVDSVQEVKKKKKKRPHKGTEKTDKGKVENDILSSDKTHEDIDAGFVVGDNEDSGGLDVNEENETGNTPYSSDDHSDNESDETSKSSDEEETKAKAAELEKYTYQPSKGEDIYGRVTDPHVSASAQKYVPPSRRLQQLDSQREEVVALKQRVTMLMNKLSEQTREYVTKELRGVFSTHSKYECIEVLVQNIYAMSCSRACVSAFIPLQISVVAALHAVVATDVGAVCVEKSLSRLLESLVDIHVQGQKDGLVEEGNKLPHNFLMVLVYLYNFKVLHHTLISDILLALCNVEAYTPSSSSCSSSSSPAYSTSDILQRCSTAYRLELVELLLLHAGHSLRQDDLPSLLLAIQRLKAAQAQLQQQEHGALPSSRFLYMLQLLTDLKQGKAKQSMQVVADSVKQHRKAIAAIKLHNQKNGQTNPLRVSLQDLLLAGERGRWWITGASFNNTNDRKGAASAANATASAIDDTTVEKTSTAGSSSSAGKSLQAQAAQALDKLSNKLQLKTSLRKSILSFLLVSRDIHDVFEKICSLSTQNKEDREVVRVLLECCGKEPVYNAFYAELIKMLCESSRQYKMSLTYAFYDVFKLLPEHSLAKDTKYLSNLAQLLADLVLAFTLPLAVLRPFDLDSMQEPCGCVFLSVFFVTLCKANVSQEAFLNVFDRLSTSKDVAEVHGQVFYFLDTVMKDIPEKLLAKEFRQQVRQRRSLALKTLKDMKTALMLGIIHIHSLSNQAPGSYLHRMVERKKLEVDNLLKRRYHENDPLYLRMHYMASEHSYNATRAIRRPAFGPSKSHTMSVVVDMKRASPTLPSHRQVVDFADAGHFASLLAQVGVDAVMVSMDDLEYGGSVKDLQDVSRAMRKVNSANPAPCIAKDMIIHPIQIAQAVEQGASAVLLQCCVVGADLSVLLDSCTLMGVEGIVEVHTPKEVEFALSLGATTFLVNLWDRMNGRLWPQQAVGIAHMFPMNAIALVAGDIHNMEQVKELGHYGYDGVVLGRRIVDIPDIKAFVDDVHNYQGPPRDYQMNMAFKAPPYHYDPLLHGQAMLRSTTPAFETLGDLPTGCWKAVASDASGQYLFAASALVCPTVAVKPKHKYKNVTSWPSSGSIYVSSNYGKHWAQTGPQGDRQDFVDIAVSVKGQNIVAIASNSRVLYSLNFGVSWTLSSNSPILSYSSVTSSNSGMKVIVAAPYTNANPASCEGFDFSTAGLWMSMDYGQNFTRDEAAPRVSWQSVACSRDCLVRLAVGVGIKTGGDDPDKCGDQGGIYVYRENWGDRKDATARGWRLSLPGDDTLWGRAVVS
eukprot:gene25019-30221_t